MLCFLIFLFAGMTATIVKPKEKTSFFENRTLSAYRRTAVKTC
jgi:hypothetical protein